MATDPVATAMTIGELARDGRFAEIEETFAPPLRAVATADTLRLAWENNVGTVRDIGTATGEPAGDRYTRVSVPITGAQGTVTLVVTVDESGLLQGLMLDPGPSDDWTPPRYARPRRFDEHEVTVGSGDLAVPGTLTLPRVRGLRLGRRRPSPGVALLSGGGPFDRDETSGPNKPLKDLAWGLASRGVAVLRFDKVTHVHAERVAATPTFTMADEYLPHAIAAVRLLRDRPEVDPARVFVLGHSMGGKAAPRVAAAEPSIAGLVLLAADTQPLPQAAVRVVRHLAALNPGPAMDAAVETITRQAANADDPALSPDTPAADLPFGYTGTYCLDLRDYDPVATAAALGKPMLILQGGRDYQVTVDDDLVRWRDGLGHRPDVTIHVHDADDHLFFPGSGPSTPAGYQAPQHVDPAVVADIAGWLARM
jgi:dienelactone hydrolase